MDAERLAALLDGRLAPEAREAALAAIGDSADDAATLAEAAAVLRELELEGELPGPAPVRPADDAPRAGHAPDGASADGRPAAPPRPLTIADAAPRPTEDAGAARPARRRWRIDWRLGGALAAGLLVTVLVVQRRPTDAAPAAGDDGRAATVRALAALPPAPGATTGDRDEGAALDGAPLFAESRAVDPALAPDARAARLGVALARLQLRAAAGDGGAREAAAAAAALLAGVPGAGPIGTELASVGSRAPGPLDPHDPRLVRVRAAASLAVDSTRVALAEWAELARVAAARGDAGFLQTPYTRATLALGLRTLAADDPARPPLDALRALGGSAAAPALRTRAEALLRALDAGARR